MKIKLLPEFVRPEHPCVGSSWVASHGGTLTPSQLKAGEAAFLGMKASLCWNASQLQDQANSDQTSPLHRRAFTQVSCPHLHELCHINTCRVTDKSRGDLYLLAHTQCTPGEYMYKTGDMVYELPHTSWFTGIASVCVYVACSTQMVTPATPAILHSLHTEQETQQPAASLF